MKSPNPMNRKGFTLIELLIVVVIIGILAAIAIPRFTQTRERAFQSAVQSDLRNLHTVQEQFYADPANSYSYGTEALIAGATPPLWSPSDGVEIDNWDVTDGGAGWEVTLSHEGLPTGDDTCTIEVGANTTQSSGAIVCDWQT